MRKRMSVTILGGLLGATLAWSQAHAWSGDLIKCSPTSGTEIDVEFKKGLTCVDTKNKIKIRARVKDGQGIDGCVANPAAPWDVWASRDAKWFKTDFAGASTITQAEVSLKGLTFGSCNFSGSDTSAGASGSGKITFLGDPPIPGAKGRDGRAPKVRGAKLKFFGTVEGDLATYSATALGLITKGLGLGMDIAIRVGLDLAAPENGLLVACNTGAICTDLDPDSPSYDDPFTSVDRCIAGPNTGMSCDGKDDCGGEKCTNRHSALCRRGDNDGLPCGNDDDCPDGRCKLQDPAIDPIEVMKIVTTPDSGLLISSGEDDPNDPNDYDSLP